MLCVTLFCISKKKTLQLVIFSYKVYKAQKQVRVHVDDIVILVMVVHLDDERAQQASCSWG